MKFLIRDDDACAFTSPKELIKSYGEIWTEVPVGLSVTPFRVPGNAHTVPKSFRTITTPLPLETNPEIVAFLKELQVGGMAQILLHGYDHTLPNGKPEYAGATDLLAKTQRGKEYLEKLLDCRLDTFVPPNNGILRAGVEAIASCGLNLLNTPALLRPSHRPVRPENITNFLRVNYFRRIKRMKYPYPLNFCDHMELACHALTPSQNLESILDAFVNCQRENGVFVVATHYHAFDRKLKSGESIRQALNILLDLAAGVPGIQFPTFSQVWESVE
ncbi:MAG: DUF2334 domain-containing protein [Gemmatimonadales bacterium]|nr:DUF2334 domain-containing protein [Gemmatimonadales bacterium]